MAELTLTLAVYAVLVLLFIRNLLAHRWMRRAIDECSALCREAIRRGDSDCFRFYDQLPSQGLLLLDLTQWRYRSPFKA